MMENRKVYKSTQKKNQNMIGDDRK